MKQLIRCLEHVLPVRMHKGTFIRFGCSVKYLARQSEPRFLQGYEVAPRAFDDILLCLRQSYKHRSAALFRLPYVTAEQHGLATEKSGAESLQSICGDLGESNLQCFIEIGVHAVHCIRTWCGSVKPLFGEAL